VAVPDSPNPTTEPAGLADFAVLLRRLNAEFHRVSHAFAQSQGLALTDVQALAALLDGDGSGGPLTPGRLRARLDLTSGAVSACLGRLERAGHLVRTRDADDGRVVHLHYAEAGRRVARDAFRPLAQAAQAARSQFTDAELAVVARFLRTLNDELATHRDGPGPGSRP
jgi:DNA-binding MarR family transcriptional regulator